MNDIIQGFNNLIPNRASQNIINFKYYLLFGLLVFITVFVLVLIQNKIFTSDPEYKVIKAQDNLVFFPMSLDKSFQPNKQDQSYQTETFQNMITGNLERQKILWNKKEMKRNEQIWSQLIVDKSSIPLQNDKKLNDLIEKEKFKHIFEFLVHQEPLKYSSLIKCDQSVYTPNELFINQLVEDSVGLEKQNLNQTINQAKELNPFESLISIETINVKDTLPSLSYKYHFPSLVDLLTEQIDENTGQVVSIIRERLSVNHLDEQNND